MMFNTLDLIDQEILKLLSENARMSYVEIGKRVNLSRVAVKSRMEALENEGIIERYSIVINPEKVGRMISAFFDVETEPSKLLEVAKKITALDQVTDVYQMTGSSKLHVHATLELNEDLERFLREDMYVIGGIVKIDCNVIVSRFKTRKGLRI
ncbi:Lrp/AsnC family transcriptional regulator [Acidaminobacter sp. JC074]|nr:Lrp/AsnC family transcriptional regulator [Acidaminobacter sp. JC074]